MAGRARLPAPPRMQSITLEVILSAVFGVEDDERRQRPAPQPGRHPGHHPVPAGDRDDRDRLRRLPAYRRITRMLAETDQILLAEIDERRADADLGSRDDILSLLVAARFEDGSAMSDTELRDQLMTLLLAGHETTATGLAWSFDLLFRAPDKLGAAARPRSRRAATSIWTRYRGDASRSPRGAVGGAQAERRRSSGATSYPRTRW